MVMLLSADIYFSSSFSLNIRSIPPHIVDILILLGIQYATPLLHEVVAYFWPLDQMVRQSRVGDPRIIYVGVQTKLRAPTLFCFCFVLFC